MDIIDMITESHLKLLGIPLGDRLRICAAICTLSMNGMRLCLVVRSHSAHKVVGAHLLSRAENITGVL